MGRMFRVTSKHLFWVVYRGCRRWLWRVGGGAQFQAAWFQLRRGALAREKLRRCWKRTLCFLNRCDMGFMYILRTVRIPQDTLVRELISSYAVVNDASDGMFFGSAVDIQIGRCRLERACLTKAAATNRTLEVINEGNRCVEDYQQWLSDAMAGYRLEARTDFNWYGCCDNGAYLTESIGDVWQLVWGMLKLSIKLLDSWVYKTSARSFHWLRLSSVSVFRIGTKWPAHE